MLQEVEPHYRKKPMSICRDELFLVLPAQGTYCIAHTHIHINIYWLSIYVYFYNILFSLCFLHRAPIRRIYICIYIYVYIYVYIHSNIWMSFCLCFMHVATRCCIYICIYTYIQIYIYICIYIVCAFCTGHLRRKYTCTYKYTHTILCRAQGTYVSHTHIYI